MLCTAAINTSNTTRTQTGGDWCWLATCWDSQKSGRQTLPRTGFRKTGKDQEKDHKILAVYGGPQVPTFVRRSGTPHRHHTRHHTTFPHVVLCYTTRKVVCCVLWCGHVTTPLFSYIVWHRTTLVDSLIWLYWLYGQLLELKLLAFLSGTLHILLFISTYCANKWWWWLSWYQTAVEQYSVTDRLTPSATDRPTVGHVQHFAAACFFHCRN